MVQMIRFGRSIISFIAVILLLTSCTLDANLASLEQLLGGSSPLVLVESPNRSKVQGDSGLVNLTLLADPTLYTEMYITNTPGCGSGGTWQPYTSTYANWLLSPAQSNSQAVVYAKFRDSASKESDCISDTIYWAIPSPYNLCDTTVTSADSFGFLYDSGGSTAGYANSENCIFKITSSSAINLTFDSVSFDTGDKIKIYDGEISTGLLLGTLKGNLTALPSAFTATSGLMTVQFVSDSYANSATGFSAHWSGESSSLFSINDGARYTNSTTVSLSFGSSSLSEVYVTNTPGCGSDGSWQAATQNMIWTLTAGDGSKNVFAKYRDSYKQETPCESASIILDAVPPVVPVITFITPFAGSNTTPEISIISTEKDIDHYEIRILRASDNAVIKDWTEVIFQGREISNSILLDGLNLVDGETYSPEIKVFSRSGQSSPAATTALTWKVQGMLTVAFGDNAYGSMGLGSQNPKSPAFTPIAAAGDYSFSQIDTGTYHSCGIDSVSGKSYCWGSNSYGQLGYNSAMDSSIPIEVVGPDGTSEINFSQISVGYLHTCGIETSTQHAYCWGGNAYGQLGNNLKLPSPLPVTVLGENGGAPIKFSQIDAGTFSTCGIEVDTKKAYCWGINTNGNLGNNTTTQSSVPVKVLGINGGDPLSFSQVSASSNFTCGIEFSTNFAYCWGTNSSGQLGINSNLQKLVPVAVLGVGGGAAKQFTQITTGTSHTCAIESTTQKAYCWGGNTNGQLGDNTVTSRLTPVAVLGVGGGAAKVYTQIATESNHTCAVEALTQKSYCWGNNTNGQLGNDADVLKTTPVAVLGVSGGASKNFSEIRTSSNSTCGLEAITHKLYCWGQNAYGQFGNGHKTSFGIPTPVSGAVDGTVISFTQVTAGYKHSCGIEAGTQNAYCWGMNTYGQLGNNSTTFSIKPVPVLGVGGGAAISFSQIAAGEYHTCAIESGTKKVYCWGNNSYGQLGDNTTTPSSTPVATLGVGGAAAMDFDQIVLGMNHTCGIEAITQKAYCWGNNFYGMLGDNTNVSKRTPVAVKGVANGVPKNYIQLSAGGSHTCGIEAITQKAYCWGSNSKGQLGFSNSTAYSFMPVAVLGVNGGASLNFSFIANGRYTSFSQTCAIEVATKHGYCWGWNGEGELGNNTDASSFFPVAMVGVDGGIPIKFKLLSLGYNHACGIEDVTNLGYCWGGIWVSENGAEISLTPVRILGDRAAQTDGLRFSEINANSNTTLGIIY